MSLDDLQAQLRGALDQQFAALRQQYETAIADVRRQAAADAERHVASRLEAARAEWDSALASILDATRAETRQQADEAARLQRRALELQLQQQLEQSVQHAVNSVRKTTELEIESLRRRVDADVQAERQRGLAALEKERGRVTDLEKERTRLEEAGLAALEDERGRVTALEDERDRLQAALDAEQQRGRAAIEEERGKLEQTVDAERQRALQELEAERARGRTEVETVQQLLEAEIASAKAEAAIAQEAAAEAEAKIVAAETAVALATAVPSPPAAPSVPAALARVPHALREVDSTTSLSATLEALLRHTGAIAGRAALFLVNGDRLKSWKAIEIPEIDVQTVESSINGRDLLARAISSGQLTFATEGLPAPPFARLATGRPAMAIPLTINGRPVAVLYADGGAAEPPQGWTEGVELVVRHVSAIAALRAAMRTLDVLRGDAADPSLTVEAPAGHGNGEENARRYARLLVSEIKLYNEAAVRAGRQQRDLRQRLRGEIDRALRMYEERVPSAVGARDQYFQQELVQTLADGDPSLLGN
jgi:hypothetical protein